MRASRTRLLASLGLVAVTACLPSGAVDPAPHPSGGADRSGWRSEQLPAGVAALTLTASQGTLVLGAARPLGPGGSGTSMSTDSVHAAGDGTAVHPLLYVGAPAADLSWGELPVQPVTGYGATTSWLAIQPDGQGRLVAVGGARGGAHANVRWTVWAGDLHAGLHEQEQTFSVFGGWGAGDQLGVLATTAGPMLLGSWESQGAGQDAAIWLPEGQRWVRQSSTDTALASTSGALVGASGGTGWGEGALVVGSVVELGAGVRQVPSAWRSTRLSLGWRRIALPVPGDGSGSGQALAAGCGTSRCLVAGRVDGRLALWIVGEADAVPLPQDLAVSERDPMVVAADPGAAGGIGAAVLASVGDRAPGPPGDTPDRTGGAGGAERSGTVLVREPTAGVWQTLAGPPGAAVAMVAAGQRWWAITRTDGQTRLWSTAL